MNKKYLLIYRAQLQTHTAEVIREVDVANADELRGEIEMIGEEISEKRGVCLRCEEVEEVEEE
jgi:hypothetical protein